jgi:mannobiose 2-epimerase
MKPVLPAVVVMQLLHHIRTTISTTVLMMALVLPALGQRKKIPDSIVTQMKFSLKNELIDIYYPTCIDTVYGGYLSSFSYDFKPTESQDKMIVTQARHVWTTAKASWFYKDSNLLNMSRHGYHFLRDKMWDSVHGGFYTLVSRQGEMKSTGKQAYGNAFGIYALAAYYQASKDESALQLAKKAFAWLEKNSHDPIYLGYYQHLERNGKPVQRNKHTPASSDLGYKDQNSSIHLLEAFTELYSVWPDPLLKMRLAEMLRLIRDTMVHPKGYLQLFFHANWKPVTNVDSSESVILQRRGLDHVSFGHDVETAYLLMEATEALGNHHDIKTLSVGKKMVDHALATGWDQNTGGFYDQGYYFKNNRSITIIKESKNWWAQAEGLNTLLIFSQMYPGDKLQYENYFLRLWEYVKTYLIDHEHGDWYEEGLDNEPERKSAMKSHIWKATYHSFRSLSNCIQRLER